jgi:hypothetical protein
MENRKWKIDKLKNEAPAIKGGVSTERNENRR